ncbi:MAG: choice-of-anchor B family protein [Saprospiraceae bacterium]
MKFVSHTEFPGQTLANICGYVQNGREYALLGASKGMVIMDVTAPATPVQIMQLPGPDNLWKEIKVLGHYAYVTSEGGQGLQIVDMSGLPKAEDVKNHFYTGDGAIAGQLNKIHALHIDEKKGVVYCFGATGVGNRGAVMLDIKTDPWNPKYLGAVTKDYIHDGFAENDTLYAGHIYRGEMEIWYTGDKSNPQSLGKVKTPTAFTHNIWLSDNHQAAFTTDENNNSFLAAYDISDPTNIRLLDKISHNIGSGAVVHNTQVLNDYAISSYYTEGVTVHDVHRPDNMVEVAHYDTYGPPVDVNDPFSGAWGVYPFLPSGNLIISNIDEGLFIVAPTYKRACYLEGTIRDKATMAAINGAKIQVLDVSTADANSNLSGIYKTGVANEGVITVNISKSGYKSAVRTASMLHGEVTLLDVELEKLPIFTLSVFVFDENNKPIENAKVTVKSSTQQLTASSNVDGLSGFVSFVDTFAIYVGKWGYHINAISSKAFLATEIINITLKKGYRDDFVSQLRYDWSGSATASAGYWELGVPKTTAFAGANATPGSDNPNDLGNECYLTGNQAGQPGSSDVDDGYVLMNSPLMDLSTYSNPTLRFDEWFYNGGGNGNIFNDSMTVILDNGMTSKTIHLLSGTKANKWNKVTIPLKGMLPLTKTMKVSFKAIDENPGNIVKAAIDLFEMVEGTVGVSDYIDENIKIAVAPNPTNAGFSVTYDINSANGELLIVNSQGQVVLRKDLDYSTANMVIGEELNAGIYFLSIRSADKWSSPLRLVKIN